MLKLQRNDIALFAFLALFVFPITIFNTALAQENNTINVDLEESLTIVSPTERQEKSETMKEEKIAPPLKQMGAGVAASDVVCKEGLKLIIKASDDSAACVKPTSASILIARGWAMQ